MIRGYINAKVNDVIYLERGHVLADFTRQDWLDLAMAALDQAGLTAQEQDRIEALLPKPAPVGAAA